jgi:hypothetical protein
MNNIVPHQFESKSINQLSEDLVIAGKLIPKGYCNATQMCKAGGKKLDRYFDNSKTTPFIEALKALHSRRSPSDRERELVIVVQGGVPELQGTWIDVNVAVNLAQWINPEFGAWAAIALTALINNDFAALTKEAEEAKQHVQSLWREVRDSGIEVRKSFTQSIKESYLKRHPETDKVPFWEYSNPRDLLNVLLTGFPAKYWSDRYQLATDEQLRNHWGLPHLRRLERIEELSQVFVDEDEMKPTEAIRKAIETFRYQVWTEEELLGLNDPKTRDRNRKRLAKLQSIGGLVNNQ